MSEPNTTPQVTMQQLVTLATGTGFGLAICATVLALLGLLLPFVSISTNMGLGGLDQSGSFNGFAAAGWVAWLASLIFALAAASGRVTQLAPYRNILSLAGLVASVVTVLFGWFLSPAAAQFAEVNRALSSAGSPGNLINIGPHIGMVVLLAAGALLYWSSRKPA